MPFHRFVKEKSRELWQDPQIGQRMIDARNTAYSTLRRG